MPGLLPVVRIEENRRKRLDRWMPHKQHGGEQHQLETEDEVEHEIGASLEPFGPVDSGRHRSRRPRACREREGLGAQLNDVTTLSRMSARATSSSADSRLGELDREEGIRIVSVDE